MFILCPNANPGLIETIFLPMIKHLPIKIYESGSEEYLALKQIEKDSGIFDEDEAFVIRQWKKAKLVLSQMSSNQIKIIRRYVMTDIKW